VRAIDDNVGGSSGGGGGKGERWMMDQLTGSGVLYIQTRPRRTRDDSRLVYQQTGNTAQPLCAII